MTSEETETTEAEANSTITYPPITVEEAPEMIQLAMKTAGWTTFSDVQAASLPFSLNRHDVMVQAKTGSGKTGAFLMPLVERIDPLEPECQALVMVPTRELAIQVIDEAENLFEEMGIQTVAVYGGVRYDKQIKAFKRGAHVIVGTPGRILDHLENGNLTLDNLGTLIFDEADRMLSMGFFPDMLALRNYLPPRPLADEDGNVTSGRQTMMFSATFPPEVRSLAYQFMHSPLTVDLSQDAIHVEEIPHVAYLVDPMEKDRILIRLLQIENPEGVVVFCNTRARVAYVATVLGRAGFNSAELTSDLAQNQREAVLRRIRSRDLQILVCTDVAARGIDIPHLSHVIQYELPDDLEVYIHRAGRTGRAGAGGNAVCLVGGLDDLKFHRIQKQYSIEFEKREPPSDEDVTQIVINRGWEKAKAKFDDMAVERKQLLPQFITEITELAEDSDKMALLAGLLLEQALHQPRPETAESEQERKPKRAYDGDRGRKGGRKGKGKGRDFRSKGKKRR